MTPEGRDRINAAGRQWAAVCARQAALSPREAAEEAHRPGGPSLDNLEAQIRAERQQAPQQRAS